MTVPAVVDKQVLDIDFSRGLNESTRPESLDWTKYLKVADNVDFGDDGVIKSRAGLYKVANVSDVGSAFYRVLSTGTGVLALGAGTNGRISAFHLDESAFTVATSLNNKGYVGEFSVSPKQLGVINGQSPAVVGSAFTTQYNISVLTPNSVDYFVYFQDTHSGNIVASYQIAYAASTAAVVVVANQYLHVYLGQAASAKVYQFDTLALPSMASTITGVAITSGTYIQAAVANTSTSVVLMRNGNLSRFTTAATPVESATGSVAGFGSNEIHDMDTDGTSFYIIGLESTPRGLMKVLNASFATTRTVTDTDATLSTARFSIAVNNASACKVVAYYATTVGAFTMPTARVISVSSGAVIFSSEQVLPCWGEVSSPYWNATTSTFYVAMVQLVDAGLGAGHVSTEPSGAVALIELGYPTWSTNAPPGGYHIAAVLDKWTDYCGNNSLTKGHVVNPQKIFSNDSGITLCLASIQRIGSQAYSSEFRTLKLNDVRGTICATDVISGGKTSFYDGVCVSELGVLPTPWITAVDAGAGTGVDLGTRSYTCIFEAVDATGRRHFSRNANPFSYTNAAAKNVTVSISYPNVSDHVTSGSIAPGTGGSNAYNFKYHVFRTGSETSTNSTTYHRIATGQVQGIGATTATISFSDTVSDASLALNDKASIGIPASNLDRYHTPASSCVVRHKDRVFTARGIDVFYSGQDVSGEAPWFNPAFRFRVHGGTGDIIALGTMDGVLVIFKQDGIWIVDGDGPPDNGGNGSEFSPPRRILTELGCVDARTLVSTDSGLMFRSLQGIQRLTRKLTVDWIGQRVFRTIDSCPYNGGAAFDSTSGRCIWLVADTGGVGTVVPANSAGLYPGQLYSSAVGYAVVYDTTNDTWSRYKFTSSVGAGKPVQDVCFSTVRSAPSFITDASRLVYVDSAKMYFEYGRVDHNTADTFIPVTLETGWIRSQSKQDRIRVTDFLIAGIRNADCTLATSYAANYSPTYVSVKTWTPSATGALTLVQLETQPPVESVQAMSFKVVTSDPTPTSFGAGSQFDIFGLSVRVGIRGGGVKLPAAQKG